MSESKKGKKISSGRLVVVVLLPVIGFAVVVRLETATVVKPVLSVEIRHSNHTQPQDALASASETVANVVQTVSLTHQSGDGRSSPSNILLAEEVLPSVGSQGLDPLTTGAFANPLERGQEALRKNIQLLEAGNRKFRNVPHYLATFVRQERIAGELCPVEEIDLKIRHEPFSVYMRWLSVDTGRELLFIDGNNDGRMLVRLGGWKGRMLPALNIDPLGPDARDRSRYPISRAGILALADILLENRRGDLARNVNVRCDYSENRPQNGRNCHYFCFEFETLGIGSLSEVGAVYDSDWLIPICVQNYTAEAGGETTVSLDEDTLIEYYSYSDINTDLRLSDTDFDRGNPEYQFR
jgi:hypothetical protein